MSEFSSRTPQCHVQASGRRSDLRSSSMSSNQKDYPLVSESLSASILVLNEKNVPIEVEVVVGGHAGCGGRLDSVCAGHQGLSGPLSNRETHDYRGETLVRSWLGETKIRPDVARLAVSLPFCKAVQQPRLHLGDSKFQ